MSLAGSSQVQSTTTIPSNSPPKIIRELIEKENFAEARQIIKDCTNPAFASKIYKESFKKVLPECCSFNCIRSEN